MEKIFILLLIFFAAACSKQLETSQKSTSEPVVIKEVFQTEHDEGDNVDSPTIWHGPDGQHWLLATAKEGDAIIVYDATNGSFVKRIGESGTKKGQFERPNGIAVIHNLALVVERDNQRIQVMRLPDFTSLGYFTHEDLRLPYGLAVDRISENTYVTYVSDNYNPALEGYPPQGELDKRIHQFKFTVSEEMVQAEHIRMFGDIRGDGVLNKVESLFVDRTHNHLLIADEAFNQRNVKIYDLEGNFTGKVIPQKYFDSEPEGITLFSCSDGSGYWITTDQHESQANKFSVFDRETFKYLGAFSGEITRNTDGIWLTQEEFGSFSKGAFYPVHDDGSVTGIDLADIEETLNIFFSCTDK